MAHRTKTRVALPPCIDVPLELDVLASLTLEPFRAARIFVTVPPATFGFGPNRALYVALRSLAWPAARPTTTSDGTRWEVHGLADACELTNAGDPAVHATTIHQAITRGPLLPFGDRMLDRLVELARRRTFLASIRRPIADLDVGDPRLDRLDRLVRDYALIDTLGDATPTEWAITTELGA